jgi:hypothetical protein
MGWTREGISDITGNEKEKNKSYECNETAAWEKKPCGNTEVIREQRASIKPKKKQHLRD